MNDQLNLTDELLISLSGHSAFKSGQDYFKSGAVLECVVKDNIVSGAVSVGNLYRVKLRHTVNHLEGRCDCLSGSDSNFCEHCVALALRYRQGRTNAAEQSSTETIDHIQTLLDAMSKSELRDALRELIEDDDRLLSSWSVKADLGLNKIDTRLIRKRITAAFPYRKRLYRHAQVKEYFAKAEHEMDLLGKQLAKLEAKKAMMLIDYAFQRLQKALESIDDSAGARLNLIESLQRLHIETLQRRDWNKNRLVSYLEELETSAAADYYATIPDAYSDALSDEGSALYLKRKQDEWDKLPMLSFGVGWEELHPYIKLQAYLLQHAKHNNDPYTEVSLLEKTCVQPKSCVHLCQRLVELGLWEKLEFWLAKAESWQKKSKNVPNLSLNRLSTQLLMHQGRTDDALKLQWETYQQSELVEDYKQLIKFADLTASSDVWRARVFRRLHKIVENPQSGHFIQRTLNHLVELYLLERQPQAALDLVNYHSLSFQALDSLINAFPLQADILFPLYQQQINLLVKQANNHAYGDAVSLVLSSRNNLQAQDDYHFDLMLETVRREHKGNTGFLQLLDDALG